MPRDIYQVKREYEERLGRKQDTLITMPAIIGRISDEEVWVSTRPGYVHVRIGNEEAPGQARCKKIAPRYDLPVIVGFDGITTEFQVLAVRQESYLTAGFGAIPEVAAHGETHEFPTIGDDTSDGSDLTYIHWRQIRGLRVKIVSSFTVQVERWPLFRTSTGKFVWITTQNLDLTGDIPGAGACYVLLYLDENGLFQKRVGSTVSKSALNFQAHCPVPNLGEWALAAALLFAGQAELKDNRDRQDVVDLRWPPAFAASTETPGNGGNGGVGTAPVTTPRWHADGPLAVLDEVDGVWKLIEDFTVETVTMYVQTIGSAGATTVDIDKSVDEGISWTTLFSTQGDRPSVTGGGSAHTNSGTPTEAQVLAVGTWLRMNIEAVATGVRNLSVQLGGVGAAGLAGEITHLGCG